jgi:hypothetical protein
MIGATFVALLALPLAFLGIATFLIELVVGYGERVSSPPSREEAVRTPVTTTRIIRAPLVERPPHGEVG